jgi:glucosamine--fructose-6-phosphate aminotransferase (isomerizing)
VAVANRAQSPELPAEHVLEMPAVPEWLSPFVAVVPLQLLTYFLALERGTNPDTAREHEPAHGRAKKHYQL